MNDPKLESPFTRARKSRHEAQEARNAALPGGSKQINSGRTTWRSKRDNRLFEFLVESRTTTKPTYTFSLEEWQAIRKEAIQTPPGCLPAMQIDIQGESIIAIDLNVFNQMQAQIAFVEDNDHHSKKA